MPRLERTSNLHELVAHVENLLDADLGDVEVVASEDADGDLVLTLERISVEDDDLVRRKTEYSVAATVTIPLYLTIQAEDEDEAERLADEFVSNYVVLLDAEADPDGEVTDARVGFIDEETEYPEEA